MTENQPLRDAPVGDGAPGARAEVVPAAGRRHRRIPIRVKAAFLIISIIIGLVLPVSFLVLARQTRQSERRIMNYGTALIETFADYSAEAVLQEDWPALDPFIREIAKLEEVRHVSITDPEGIVKAHSEVSRMEETYRQPQRLETVSTAGGLLVIRYRAPGGESILDFSRDIIYQGKRFGRMHLGISETSMIRDTRSLRFYIMILTLLAVAAGAGISWGAGSLISRSLSSLIRGTREIEAGNLDYRIPPGGNDELGDLSRAFNEMADGLKKKGFIEATFGRYVTPEIVDLILRSPERTWLRGSRKTVTILFADIRNFTAFAEEREPEELVGVLNHFFRIATEAIQAEKGYVNKFHGDEVMAVFGAPIFHDDHARRAVRCAVRLQQALEEWNLKRAITGGPPVRAGIGVNTGQVIAGNLGTEQRMEYTVVGDSVNLASRLTGLAGPGEIIASERTRELVADMAQLVQLDPRSLKGKKNPVVVYRVEGLIDVQS